MDFDLTSDQIALRDELRRLLSDRCGRDARRAMMSMQGAIDRDLWRGLAEMGVFSLCLPEDAGGVGLGWAEATIVFEELGRAAAPGPLVATFLAAEFVEGVAEGAVVLGVVERNSPVFVEHLDGLDGLLVVGDDVIERVPTEALTVDTVARPLDPLTPLHLLVSPLPSGVAVVEGDGVARWQRCGSLLIAATQVGLGAAAIELAVAYAKERRQFGRTIGSFQAVKHLLADAHVDVESARAAVHAAGVEADEDATDAVLERAVAAARIVASRAARRAGEACVQVHGGIGYTWELDAHLFLKRSLVLDTMFGSVDGCFEAMAASV